VGNHSPGGGAGTSIRLAQSFYNIAYSYYRDRFLDQGSGSGLLGAFLERVVSKRTAPGRGVSGTLRQVATRCLRPWRTSSLPGIEQQILAEITDLLRNGPSEPEEPDPDQANFGLACRISQQLSYTFLKNFSERVRAGSFLESLQTLASLGPVALSMAPYLTAFRTQHKDDPLLAQVSRRFKLPSPTPGRRERKAWITDTYTDINGVSRSIQKLGALAQSHGFDLTVVTCQAESPASQNLKLTCFPPVGRFRLPEYDTQELVFPPFMEILQYLEQGGFTELIVSTPGPLGLTALAAGRLLGLRLTGIYHTDFPQYVQCLTEDEALTGMTWRYMEWFYGRMDRVFAPSAWYRRELLKRGFAADAVQVLPRGVDTAVFHPGNRVEDYWTSHGCNGGFKFLYAGRVSREKNLETLFRAFNDYRNSDAPTADLIVVGDGPDLAEFRKRMQGDPGVVFTGFMDSSELARAYASADAFVFPSLSDTFGNVVLEAQASGLPAIVADVGGPPEIVVAGESGLQVDMRSATSLAAAMGELARDPARHESMRRNAVRNAAGSDWTRILELLWEDPGPAPATDRSRPCASA
jgi:glycosyltransferase involved in cell wall biosynthesis